MKVACVTGVETSGIVEVPMPEREEGFALIQIQSAPMCTEVQGFQKGQINNCLGHEAAGVVVEAAEGGRHKVGDRVVVMPQNGCGKCSLCLSGEHIRCQSPHSLNRATFAEYCVQQDWLLFPVPDDISIDHAAMACCGLGPTFGAMEAMSTAVGHTVLISGLGAVGLGGVVNAIGRGARVVGIEGHPYRAALALAIGATAVLDPQDPDLLAQVRSLTAGIGADHSIETSSQESAPGFLLQATRIGGQMTSVGWGGPVNMRDVVARGVTVRGQWHWNHLRHGEAMLATIRRTAVLIDQLITHRFPLSDVQTAWELQATRECGKVILQP